MLFYYIIISCCANLGGDRSVTAVYHLLRGKRSIQTLQDSHIYDLKQYYGIYPGLHKSHFDEQIDHLVNNNLVVLKENSIAVPTDLGYDCLDRHETKTLVQFFNGIAFNRTAPVFWERLLLTIQTMTNSRSNHFNFIPVIDKPDVTRWVKNYYRQWRNFQAVFLNRLYRELYQILKLAGEREASILVDSLTGYKYYGMSSFQIGEYYGLKQIEVPLIRTAIVHRMLAIINQDKTKYPTLASFMQDIPEESMLTNSAHKTCELLNRQYSPEDIARIRQLKLSTIYDHMVEIALYDESFPLDHYVAPDLQAEIRSAISRTESYKLKDIKQDISDTISYFQIRLVLATEK